MVNVLVRDEQNVLQYDDLRIDLTHGEVFLNNEKVNCSTMEFELLRFFVLHPNRVFTREQLLKHVWGYHDCGDVRTVTVHIRKLREKIERCPSNPTWIKTVWGIGYRFDGGS